MSHLISRNGRWYADLRNEKGDRKRIALKPPGENRATKDRDVANVLLAQELERIEKAKESLRKAFIRGEDPHSDRKESGLGPFAEKHLKEKAEEGRVTVEWIARAEAHLKVACKYFGAGRDLRSIDPSDIKRYLKYLRDVENGRGGKLSPGTRRHYINAMSSLYARAIELGYTERNPVAQVRHKPSAASAEASFLEVPDATALLEAARHYDPPADSGPAPFLYELIATYLLTGGRLNEVLGLEVDDVSFDRGRIHFRPNRYRRLKSKTSHRTVPLWPQLYEILMAYLNGPNGPSQGLLFPSVKTGGMVKDFRKQLDGAAKLAGWKAGEIRSKVFRHTFTSARLQTADRIIRTLPDGSEEELWVPVSPFSVAKELGHGGTSLVERVYGHIAGSPHRSDQVEYRVEQHREHVRARLKLVA